MAKIADLSYISYVELHNGISYIKISPVDQDRTIAFKYIYPMQNSNKHFFNFLPFLRNSGRISLR